MIAASSYLSDLRNISKTEGAPTHAAPISNFYLRKSHHNVQLRKFKLTPMHYNRNSSILTSKNIRNIQRQPQWSQIRSLAFAKINRNRKSSTVTQNLEDLGSVLERTWKFMRQSPEPKKPLDQNQQNDFKKQLVQQSEKLAERHKVLQKAFQAKTTLQYELSDLEKDVYKHTPYRQHQTIRIPSTHNLRGSKKIIRPDYLKKSIQYSTIPARPTVQKPKLHTEPSALSEQPSYVSSNTTYIQKPEFGREFRQRIKSVNQKQYDGQVQDFLKNQHNQPNEKKIKDLSDTILGMRTTSLARNNSKIQSRSISQLETRNRNVYWRHQQSKSVMVKKKPKSDIEDLDLSKNAVLPITRMIQRLQQATISPVGAKKREKPQEISPKPLEQRIVEQEVFRRQRVRKEFELNREYQQKQQYFERERQLLRQKLAEKKSQEIQQIYNTNSYFQDYKNQQNSQRQLEIESPLTTIDWSIQQGNKSMHLPSSIVNDQIYDTRQQRSVSLLQNRSKSRTIEPDDKYFDLNKSSYTKNEFNRKKSSFSQSYHIQQPHLSASTNLCDVSTSLYKIIYELQDMLQLDDGKENQKN